MTNSEFGNQERGKYMGTKIENLTEKPLWLRLNSGGSVVVPPHALSSELPDHEVEGNPTLNKLLERRVIARPKLEGEEAKGEEAKSGKGKTRRPG